MILTNASARLPISIPRCNYCELLLPFGKLCFYIHRSVQYAHDTKLIRVIPKENHIIPVSARADVFAQFGSGTKGFWLGGNFCALAAQFGDEGECAVRIVLCDVIADCFDILLGEW